MTGLRMLRLQNNQLKTLPHEIAGLMSLDDIDCSNNNTLTMVPPSWRSDTDSVIFVCTIHRDYEIKMEELLRTNEDLTKHSQFLESEQLKMSEVNDELKFQLKELKKMIPKKVKQQISKNSKIVFEDEVGGKEESSCIIM